MQAGPDFTYRPLDTLKRLAQDVWIVDGPAIAFSMPGLKIPFPTRMTVIRCDGNALLVHSPTGLDTALQREIGVIGDPRWIIAPNRIHYWWVPDWHAAYPQAQVYLAPHVKTEAGAHIPFDGLPLEGEQGYPWDDEIATLPIAGRYMTEVEFFHPASRTLVLTDLIENFEPLRLGSVVLYWLTRFGGVQYPNGSMPRDMRLSFPRAQLRAAVERMIRWDPERVIIAHGLWFNRNGAAELRRAFRWLLK